MMSERISGYLSGDFADLAVPASSDTMAGEYVCSTAEEDLCSRKESKENMDMGYISTVMVKDMSRIGMDYLQTGFYTEIFFRQHGVHFVAIAKSVDSDDQNSGEFAPFLNIMNEWYLRDLSRKQRTAIRVKNVFVKTAVLPLPRRERTSSIAPRNIGTNAIVSCGMNDTKQRKR